MRILVVYSLLLSIAATALADTIATCAIGSSVTNPAFCVPSNCGTEPNPPAPTPSSSYPWLNPGRAETDAGAAAYSTVSVSNNHPESDYLVCNGFFAAIPPGNGVSSLTVMVREYQSAKGVITDQHVFLSQGIDPILTGTDQANTNHFWASPLGAIEQQYYPAVGSDWNDPLCISTYPTPCSVGPTPGYNVNDPQFGVALSVNKNGGGSAGSTGDVDVVAMQLKYAPFTPTSPPTATGTTTSTPSSTPTITNTAPPPTATNTPTARTTLAPNSCM